MAQCAHLLDVQLGGDERRQPGDPLLLASIARGEFDQRQRLAHTDGLLAAIHFGIHPRREAKADQALHQAHLRHQLFIAPGPFDRRPFAKWHRVRFSARDQIPIDRLAQKGHAGASNLLRVTSAS